MAQRLTDGASPAWVEISGENPRLARAELDGALAALGGRSFEPPGPGLGETFVGVELPISVALLHLAARLAMARRVLVELRPSSSSVSLEDQVGGEGVSGRSASFRPLAGPRSSLVAPTALQVAAAYRRGGGRIDLDAPDRRFWIGGDASAPRIFEEIGTVDRAAIERRRMPRLPFQRPVSLPPRLGRVAANLAQLRTGDTVVDPFVGTGALLLEAGLLGARVSGVDRDDEMIRGTLRNLAAFGIEPERLAVADAAAAFPPSSGDGWSAVLTDPPYGRASGSGGEAPSDLLARVLPRWASEVRPGGAVVVIVPGGPDPLGEPWVRVVSISDRVHRSLTREFRVYRRRGDGAATS